MQVRRYTFPAIEDVIPCVPNSESIWETQYFWYFEFVFIGTEVVAQFVLSCKNSPNDTFGIFKRINENMDFRYTKHLTDKREYGVPFKTDSVDLDGKTDDEIKATFEHLYEKLMDFEHRLISYLSES